MNIGQVSVIIPIYNIERYLPECLDSVCGQTYQDLQIILVDDGSTDLCGKICEDYAKRDCRILTIHKANGGLSDARNAGLPYVTGEYLFYLDSDDFLETDSIEIMVQIMETNNSDIVIGNFFYTYEKREEVAISQFQKETSLNNYEAMKALVTGKIQNFAWGKLMKTEIAVKHGFPKGKLFEDTYWAHLILADAQETTILKQPLVHYRQRENGISYTYTPERLDVIEGWINRKIFLEKNYPELTESFLAYIADGYVNIAWLVLTRMKSQRKKAFQKMREYNKILLLQNYSVGVNQLLIKKLEKSSWSYSVHALLNRVMRRNER